MPVLPPPQVRLVVVGHAIWRGDEFHRRAPRHLAVADLVSRAFFGRIGDSPWCREGCAARLLEARDRCVDVVGVEPKCVMPKSLARIGCACSGPCISKSSMSGPVPIFTIACARTTVPGKAPTPARTQGPAAADPAAQGLIDHLAAKGLDQKRFRCFDVGHGDADVIDAAD